MHVTACQIISNLTSHGGIAQLGECLPYKQDVGSGRLTAGAYLRFIPESFTLA
jgi:hypothetical protein